MMMAEEAKLLGHTIVSLDPNPQCSITAFSDCHISKDYSDEEVLEYLNEVCDVITYEFENVDLDVLNKYIDKIPQKLKALKLSRNRIVEKDYAKKLGIKTPTYVEVVEKKDIFYPAIIKTITGGYDGKGQYLLRNKEDVDQVDNIGTVAYVCEELINYDYEISVIATRDSFGNIGFFPIPKNTHKKGILHTSIIDESIPMDIQAVAKEYTTKLLEDLDYIGTLAVEYFVVRNDVLFNEFAPRPHNSGHYTQDGTQVSQFKNHILAITGEEIIAPIKKENTLMINVLGQNQDFYRNSMMLDNAVNHDYYKNSNKTNRKIGHINIPFNNQEDIKMIMSQIIKEQYHE